MHLVFREIEKKTQHFANFRNLAQISKIYGNYRNGKKRDISKNAEMYKFENFRKKIKSKYCEYFSSLSENAIPETGENGPFPRNGGHPLFRVKVCF